MTPTSKLVVDSWAWVELFTGSERGKVVEGRIAGAKETFTTAFSLAEVVSTAARRKRPTDDKIAVIQSQSKIISPSSDDAIEAGRLHASTKSQVPNFSLTDAFVLQAARQRGARVLTGDPDFVGVKEADLIE